MMQCEYAAACDARALHIGSYSSWLSKVKGDGARARWMSSSTKRYFTIDFDSQLFYYSHSADRKKISNPIRFKEILSAEQLPRPSQPTGNKAGEFTFGFAVKTAGRTYELYTVAYNDAKHWVDGLNAGRDIANGLIHTNNNSCPASTSQPINSCPSRSSMSTTADGSDSGRSSEQERDFSRYGGYNAGTAGPAPPRGPQPLQPPVASQPAVAPQAPWQPPVAYGNYGHSSTGPSSFTGGGGYGPPAPAPAAARRASAPPVAPAPAPVREPEPVDPFAALDALEEMAGPLPEQAMGHVGSGQQQNIQGALLREARDMLTKKGARPSVEANEALRSLREGPKPSAPAPLAAAALGWAVPSALAAPVAPVPLAAAPVAPAPLPVQPQQAPSQQPAAQAARTYHNAAADNWDSDDDTELLSRGLLAGQASPPVALTQLAPAPLATTPQRVPAAAFGCAQPGAGLAPLPQAPVARAPAARAPAARAPAALSSDASGWDSDDDTTLQQKASPPVRHQLATGPQHGATECSGWDSDEDTGAVTKAARAPKQTRGSCGAPPQAVEAFVKAKARPPAVSSTQPVKSGDDLDDLMGDILSADATVSRGVGGVSHSLVQGFQCTACDFQVLRIDNYVWGNGVEYMFFRNNYPNVQKLRPQLLQQKDCCAYCCQCSWKSAESAAPLADVAEGLRWRSIGF